jgi:hypothetical protein
MGLDNIPTYYACKNQGTAIIDVDGRIDCQLTQQKGCCPWKNELEKSNVTQKVVLGIFGTDCWYRGKYAEALTSEYDNAPHSFYGAIQSMDDDGNTEEGLSPDQCIELSEWMDDIYDDYGADFDPEIVDDWKYISWWLTFVANNCDGFRSWY